MRKLKKGDKVRWLRNRFGRITRKGVGVITRIYPPFGNVPWTCEVSSYKDGVLFADEVKRAI